MSAVANISPIGENQDRIGVLRRQKKVQVTIFAESTKYGDRFTFQSVARPENSYLIWQWVMVGSLSINRSTGSTTTSSSTAFGDGSETPILSG